MEYDAFARHLNEVFTTEEAGTPVDLKLVECTALPQQPGLKRAPFSLIFVGSAAQPLSQRIYPLTHASAGEMSIFLVPLGPGEGGMQYQAIFS